MKINLKVCARSSLLVACLGVLLLSGCETRSISNSGYQGNGYNSYSGNSFYRGELSEFDVLDIERSESISEAEIGKALDNATRVKLKRNGSILLIQSGAAFPDTPMTEEFGKVFSITPFSGQPQQDKAGKSENQTEKTSYSKSIRMAAARGGHEFIICYWGILESARESKISKPISWIPIVGWSIPDETQHMRIKLKFALIDVRTGNWSIYAPEPFEQKALSAYYNRANSDQRQVVSLKEEAYRAGAREVVKIYSN